MGDPVHHKGPAHSLSLLEELENLRPLREEHLVLEGRVSVDRNEGDLKGDLLVVEILDDPAETLGLFVGVDVLQADQGVAGGRMVLSEKVVEEIGED